MKLSEVIVDADFSVYLKGVFIGFRSKSLYITSEKQYQAAIDEAVQMVLDYEIEEKKNDQRNKT